MAIKAMTWIIAEAEIEKKKRVDLCLIDRKRFCDFYNEFSFNPSRSHDERPNENVF